MRALRKILKVTQGKIILDLPDDFQSDQVEVIVLPYVSDEKERLRENPDAWKEDFLSISQWEEDVPRVKSWNIETF